MSTTLTGALIGAVLAFAVLVFGFWGFVLVALFMFVGAIVGRAITGQLDLRALFGVLTGRRTSS